jgi:formate-dependent nitrite reductase membrane component NrfD
MQRTRWAVIAILVLIGAVFIGQGTGLLQGSSVMVGDPFWAFAGLTLVVAGGVLAAVGLRSRGA